MKEQDMKRIILQVLESYQDSQINIKSETARNILAEEIADRIVKTTNLKLADNE